MFSKKGISNIVVLSLLLLVTLISFFSLQGWFITYYENNVKSISDKQLKNLEIISINQTHILIKNSNDRELTLNEIQIGNSLCNINNKSNGNSITKFSLDNCSLSIQKNSYNIKIIALEGIFTNRIFLSENIISINCSQIPYGDWILVPGDMALNTNDFCVMKYEAKFQNNSGKIANSFNSYEYDIAPGDLNITSTPKNGPITKISQNEAILECKNLGDGFDLISNNEWMTIARNIETQAENWDSGIVYSGSLFNGHNDGSPFEALEVTNTNDGYDGTGNSLLSNQRRSLTLSTNETIWDLSGNIWELTSDIVDCSGGYYCSNMPYDVSPSTEWVSFSNLNTIGSFSIESLFPKNTSISTSQGTGEIFTDNSLGSGTPNSNQHLVIKGGRFNNGNSAGIYSTLLDVGINGKFSTVGFRCVYQK